MNRKYENFPIICKERGSLHSSKLSKYVCIYLRGRQVSHGVLRCPETVYKPIRFHKNGEWVFALSVKYMYLVEFGSSQA